MPNQIILASRSIIRRQLLENAGVTPTVERARIDETALKASLLAEGATPRDIADTLAEIKAQRVSTRFPQALVIGADQVLDLNGILVNKPQTRAEAKAQLLQLRGRQHSLISAVVLLRGGQPVWRHIGRANLWMRNFSDGFLDHYLAEMGDDILTTVGCYKLEKQGVRLFSKIEGDYFTVLGMPLVEILNYLSETGMLEK